MRSLILPKAPIPDCIRGKRIMKATMMMSIGTAIVKIEDQIEA